MVMMRRRQKQQTNMRWRVQEMLVRQQQGDKDGDEETG
jgi:hypothetical protein